MSKSNKGFSLLELLIVVAIILIIATIAIPSLLRSRQAAHEAAAGTAERRRQMRIKIKGSIPESRRRGN